MEFDNQRGECSLFRIEDLSTTGMAIKLESTVYARPENIFFIFDTVSNFIFKRKRGEIEIKHAAIRQFEFDLF